VQQAQIEATMTTLHSQWWWLHKNLVALGRRRAVCIITCIITCKGCLCCWDLYNATPTTQKGQPSSTITDLTSPSTLSMKQQAYGHTIPNTHAVHQFWYLGASMGDGGCRKEQMQPNEYIMSCSSKPPLHTKGPAIPAYKVQGQVRTGNRSKSNM
jgi:hypothetical protein